ncbi:hypothetical protein Taro_022767 [Colocasia esculenta]|uniref:Uncharacterized protein n=1 Tax=Colocasia esculenta TaxID=4460 RepID=A0A843V6A3_COLES|nr:hypothetical protein [Colocasia esculenta]
MRKLYILTKYDERHIKIGITCKWPTSMGEYIAVRVEDDETVESMFDLYPSHVSTVQLYLEKEDVDNISIQGNDEVQTHGHIDDNLYTQHYEYQQPSGLFTRMLNDDADSTGFYSANERDVRYESYDYTLPTYYNPWSIGYGGGSSQYPFMPITDPSHTFHSASSSGHHVTEEHVIEKDEEDEIDSQDDIDDNDNMDEGDDEPLSDIVRVNNTKIEYEQDPPDIFASDQWIDEAMLNNSHEGIDVPYRVLRQFGRVQHIPGPVDALDPITRKGCGHIDWARYFAHFVQMWHRRRDYIMPPDEDTVGIGRVEHIFWYWSITRRYIGQPGFTYDMRYEPRDHIERSLVEGMKHLHMMVTDGLQDDMLSDSTQSRYIAMQMYIYSVLSQVQWTDSPASDAGPSEPCAGMPQQPDEAGPPQFSSDVMTFSQHGLYDVGASQILIDEGC